MRFLEHFELSFPVRQSVTTVKPTEFNTLLSTCLAISEFSGTTVSAFSAATFLVTISAFSGSACFACLGCRRALLASVACRKGRGGAEPMISYRGSILLYTALAVRSILLYTVLAVRSALPLFWGCEALSHGFSGAKRSPVVLAVRSALLRF